MEIKIKKDSKNIKRVLLFVIPMLIIVFFQTLFLVYLASLEDTMIIYKDEIKKVDVTKYEYDIPIIPGMKSSGKEIVILDKSGSMRKFVNDIYLSNTKFFIKKTVWSFDTKINKQVDIDKAAFENNTDIFLVLNEAIKEGYTNIFMFSDMENTAGEMKLKVLGTEKINLFIFSPKKLTENSNAAMNILKNSKEIEKIKLITIKLS